jgi:two-component system, OmpR family, phosphate regulon sensor histidine kinase PhoR
MFKNLTPRQIAIFSATVTGILIMFFYFLLSVMGLDRYWWSGLIILAALIIIAYLVNIFFLKRYIFRKIKLIYKTIHRLKLDPSQKQRNIDIGDHIFEDVEKDVALWAQDRQQEIDQLKTLENYRRDFLGNVSHELKTPIFNIQGYIHTLIDGGLQDPTINLKYLDRTAKNVDRLITIVDDLETISKLESGNLVLDIRKFDIRDLVKEVFESHEMTAQRRNIQLLFKEGAAQSYQVKADREYVRQVLDNLVLNSIKYGRTNGFTKVGFYDMDKYILVEVADNGLGISQEHLKHVFDRFYRVDKSRSREAGGSGLGLSIVKHIIEAHNQTINVRSSPNVGSTFGFTLAKV